MYVCMNVCRVCYVCMYVGRSVSDNLSYGTNHPFVTLEAYEEYVLFKNQHSVRTDRSASLFISIDIYHQHPN